MLLKHKHDFQMYAHVAGGTHGNIFRCECGTRRFSGVMDDTIVVALARPGGDWKKLKLYGPKAPRGSLMM